MKCGSSVKVEQSANLPTLKTFYFLTRLVSLLRRAQDQFGHVLSGVPFPRPVWPRSRHQTSGRFLAKDPAAKRRQMLQSDRHSAHGKYCVGNVFFSDSYAGSVTYSWVPPCGLVLGTHRISLTNVFTIRHGLGDMEKDNFLVFFCERDANVLKLCYVLNVSFVVKYASRQRFF